MLLAVHYRVMEHAGSLESTQDRVLESTQDRVLESTQDRVLESTQDRVWRALKIELPSAIALFEKGNA